MTTFLITGVVGLLLVAISVVAADLFDGVLDVLAGDWFSGAVLGASSRPLVSAVRWLRRWVVRSPLHSPSRWAAGCWSAGSRPG